MAAGRTRGSRPRRVSLPGVAELLRPVGPGPANDSGRQASGREAHPLKITVYLAADEFLDLERARLTLRAHGIGVDRGRLVREAIALLMTDLEAGIDASVIARRLRAAGEPAPDGAPAAGGPVHGVPSGGTPASGGPGYGIPGSGDAALGAPPAVPVYGVLASGGLAGGGPDSGIPGAGFAAVGVPVVGVLANGIPAAGPPEGPQ